MGKKGTRVTSKEKEKMWRLYQDLGTYLAVAKKMRRDPGTVSRYVQEYETALGVAGIIIKQKEV